MSKQTYRVEVTDTFGGEANYCWVHRYTVMASSVLGAARIVGRLEGLQFRKEFDLGDCARYNAVGAHVCAFIE